MGLGEMILTHLESAFGASRRVAVLQPDPGAAIQILEFPIAFTGASFFSTYGLVHYAERTGGPVEVVCGTDRVGDPEIAVRLAQACLEGVARRVPLRVGTVVQSSQGWEWEGGRGGFFLCELAGGPEWFGKIPGCTFLLGMPLSIDERELLESRGLEWFGQRITDLDIDAFAIARPRVTR